MQGAAIRHALISAALLAGVWLSWSGHYTPLILSMGALSCALVLWVALRMEVLDHEALPYGLLTRHVVYAPWLLWQIAVSSVHVAAVILKPGLPIRPRLVRVGASQKTELGQVIHANSITLTPGTISLDIRDGQILVHALTEQSAAGLEDAEIDRRVRVLEGDA